MLRSLAHRLIDRVRVPGLRRVAADERGLALVLALGVMTVLSASAVVVVDQATSNASNAQLSKDDNRAYRLAETGMNNAMAVLSNQPANNPMNAGLFPQTWTYPDGTATVTGTLNVSAAVWTLTSTGRTTNTTGTATNQQTATLTASVSISPRDTQPQQNNAWDYVFVYGTGQTCDMTMPSSFTWNSPLYVVGNLCLNNNAKITGGPLVVKKQVDLSTSSSAIGSSSSPISSAQVGIGCQYANQHWHPDASHSSHAHCSSVDNVWATGGVGQNPENVPIPVAEWDVWYQNAIPGPKYPCTTTTGTPPVFENETVSPTRNNSVAGIFNLTPATAYECRVGPANNPIGQLKWDPTTTPKKLTIHGTMFIDGSAIVSGQLDAVEYDGHGTIYLSGSFTVANDQELCTSTTGTPPSDCAYSAWNPNSEMITIVANGSVSIGSTARFQGAIYSSSTLELASGAKTEGPLVVPSIQLGSGAVTDPWDRVDTVPTGTPGTTPVFGYPNPPSSYSG